MNTENQRKTRLQKLSGSDFEIVDGQPDIRGWDVKDNSGSRLGKVDELIFDYQSRKVRYIVVKTNKSNNDTAERDVLIPIGIAELHKDDDDVILPGITNDQLSMLPGYDENRFDTAHESSVRNVFGGLGTAAATTTGDNEDEFYNHEHFNEDNFYRNRRGNAADDTNTPSMKGSSSETGGREGGWLRSKNVDQ